MCSIYNQNIVSAAIYHYRIYNFSGSDSQQICRESLRYVITLFALIPSLASGTNI